METKEFSCGHRMIAVTLQETIGFNDELRLKLKGSKGKRKRTREIVSRKSGNFERRTVIERSESGTKVIMIDWKKGTLSHIHCKICGNEWRQKEDMAEKFDIEPTSSGVVWVRCKKCGG